MKAWRQRALQSFCCVACPFVLPAVDGEFIGGQVGSYLFRADDMALALFVSAAAMTWIRLRVGAAMALGACALTAPLVLWLLARTPSDPRLTGAVAALVLTSLVCIRGVRQPRQHP